MSVGRSSCCKFDMHNWYWTSLVDGLLSDSACEESLWIYSEGGSLHENETEKRRESPSCLSLILIGSSDISENGLKNYC